jgi:hypothetical protein
MSDLYRVLEYVPFVLQYSLTFSDIGYWPSNWISVRSVWIRETNHPACFFQGSGNIWNPSPDDLLTRVKTSVNDYVQPRDTIRRRTINSKVSKFSLFQYSQRAKGISCLHYYYVPVNGIKPYPYLPPYLGSFRIASVLRYHLIFPFPQFQKRSTRPTKVSKPEAEPRLCVFFTKY